MKVILLQDIEKIGKKYEVKEIKDGYARNLLIPKGLVKIATNDALKWLEVQKETGTKKAEEELKKIQSLASGIDGAEVVITVKIGEKDQLFEKVNAQRISEKLKEMGIEVKKSQIDLPEPLQALGEFPIKVKLDHNLEAEITVVVVEEKK